MHRAVGKTSLGHNCNAAPTEAVWPRAQAVTGGEAWVCVVDILQKLVEMGNVCWVKILCAFGVQIPRLGCADLRMALLEPVDPVRAWNNATHVKHEGPDVVSVKWICDNSLVIDPIHKCCLLWLGKNLLALVCILLGPMSMQVIPQCHIRNLMN